MISLCFFRRTATAFYLLFGLTLCVAARAQVSLTVNANQVVRTVDERVFGVNAVMWDGQSGSAQTVSLVEAAGLRAIRIPGGSLSDEYHWRTNTNLSNTWTWASGFDSFIKLITGLNAQAYVTVNYGTGTPEEAAAWVAYSNSSASILGTASDVAIGVDSKGYDWKTAGYWSALRNSAPLATNDGMNFLRISRASPLGLKYWEIGNECYGTWETDQQAVPHDPYTYAVRSKAYIAKMKAVDASIKIGVVAVTGETSNTNNTNHPATNPRTGVVRNGWTPVMLATLKAAPTVTPDYLIYHRYEQAPAADQPANPESDANLLQKAKTWPQDAADLRQQLADYLGSAGAGVELAVTENNSVYGKPGKQTTSLVNGLFYADSVGNLLQTEFNSLLWWDLRNGQENTNNNSASLYGWRQYGDYGILSTPSSFGSATAYEPYPTYYVMKLLSKFARNGDTVVQASSNNTLLSIFAAKRTDGSLSLLVINKDPTSILNANITLTGFQLGAPSTVYSYGKSQDTVGNSADIVTSSETFSGSTFSTSFAPYSVTVFSFATAVTPSITTHPLNQKVKLGSSVTFTALASGEPKPTYQWLRNDIIIPGATGSSFTITAVNAADSGGYRVVVTNVMGSVTSNAAILTVFASGGDFNSDGQTDILWQNTASGQRALWLMNGIGGGFTPTSVVNLGYVDINWRMAGTGDFNNDGQTDILWQNTASGQRALWLMNGIGGGFTPTSVVNLGYVDINWRMAGTGDFNSDGQTDILWQNMASGQRALWLMNGISGGFTPANIVNLGIVDTNWVVAGAGDFNNDSQTDILWQNTASGQRALWLMNGIGGGFTPASIVNLGIVDTNWVVAGVGDFNNDAQTDILWQNTASGQRALWLMNGIGGGFTPVSIVNLGYVDTNWIMVN